MIYECGEGVTYMVADTVCNEEKLKLVLDVKTNVLTCSTVETFNSWKAEENLEQRDASQDEAAEMMLLCAEEVVDGIQFFSDDFDLGVTECLTTFLIGIGMCEDDDPKDVAARIKRATSRMLNEEASRLARAIEPTVSTLPVLRLYGIDADVVADFVMSTIEGYVLTADVSDEEE